MQEYNEYNFKVDIDNLTELIQAAIAAGNKPLLYINGLYYDIITETTN